MADERTQFDYLLNALEDALTREYPGKHGYAEKRRALFAYVRDLERRAAAPAQQPAGWVLGAIADGKVITMIMPSAGGATPVFAGPSQRPPCTVCGRAYEKHGTYPTCATHPYTPDGTCQYVVGAVCPGAECEAGCVRARAAGSATAVAPDRAEFEAAMREASSGEPDWKSAAALWAWKAWCIARKSPAHGVMAAPAPSAFFTPEMLAKAVMTQEQEDTVRRGCCPKCMERTLGEPVAGGGVAFRQCSRCTSVYALGLGGKTHG